MISKTWRSLALAATLAAGAASAQAVTLLEEGFEDVASLQTQGWGFVNGSSVPLGPGFGQGDAAKFAAQAGTPDSFAFSGFAINDAPDGEIYAALVTPELDLSKDTELTFWTRTVAGSTFPDRLSVGMFASDGSGGELLTINLSLLKTGYPSQWKAYSVALGGLGTGVTGSFYFEYFIGDATVAGNYIGIDTVTVTAVPEPGTWLMLGLGLAGLGALARRRAA